jgi:hypothetical protein
MSSKKPPKGLDKSKFSKIKQEFHDVEEYIHKLNQEQREWLSRFMWEDLGANLNHSEKKLHKSKKSIKNIYDRNNARNRDIYARQRAQGLIILREESSDDLYAMYANDLISHGLNEEELRMIEQLDKKLHNGENNG